MRLRKAYLLGFLVIALACSAAQSICAKEAPVADAPPQVFRDARAMLGQEVAVKGVLRWTFENRNLFPLGTDPDEPSEAYCLPVLIKRTDSDRQKIAESFDRSVVVVKGRIIDPAPPGQVSLGSCKPVGIEVESIEPAE
jgi:hypothetical protein